MLGLSVRKAPVALYVLLKLICCVAAVGTYIAHYMPPERRVYASSIDIDECPYQLAFYNLQMGIAVHTGLSIWEVTHDAVHQNNTQYTIHVRVARTGAEHDVGNSLTDVKGLNSLKCWNAMGIHDFYQKSAMDCYILLI